MNCLEIFFNQLKPIRFFLLLAASLCFSCSSKNTIPPTLLFERTTPDFHLKVSLSGTKMDQHGVIQCARFAEQSLQDQAYISLGFNFITTMAFLLDLSPKYLEGHDSLSNVYLDIELTTLSKKLDDVEYKAFVADEILKWFKFKLVEERELIEGFNLIVANEQTLFSHLSNAEKVLPPSISEGKLKMESSSLSVLQTVLNNYFSMHFAFDGSNDNFYNFELNISDFEKMKNDLTRFGLALEPKCWYVNKYFLKSETE